MSGMSEDLDPTRAVRVEQGELLWYISDGPPGWSRRRYVKLDTDTGDVEFVREREACSMWENGDVAYAELGKVKMDDLRDTWGVYMDDTKYRERLANRGLAM